MVVNDSVHFGRSVVVGLGFRGVVRVVLVVACVVLVVAVTPG